MFTVILVIYVTEYKIIIIRSSILLLYANMLYTKWLYIKLLLQLKFVLYIPPTYNNNHTYYY